MTQITFISKDDGQTFSQTFKFKELLSDVIDRINVFRQKPIKIVYNKYGQKIPTNFMLREEITLYF